MTSVRLTLLGGVSVDVDGRRLGLAEAPPTKALAALCYLAISHKSASRKRLVEMLWPASTGDDQGANLRVALSHLRKAMPGVVEADREQLRLAHDAEVRIDTEEFSRLASDGTVDSLMRAAELYSGDFMEGFDLDDAPAFEEWRMAEVERLRLLARGCLESLAEQNLAKGDIPRAKENATRLTRLEPWREAAQRRLMRLHAESGDHDLALQQYQACTATLASELGIEPSPATTRLAERIDAARRATQPELPRPSTPFIGREREVVELSAQLLVPEVRLVTLVGIGGVGKTRLALAVTERLRYRYLEGVRFLDLAEVMSRNDLIERLHDAVMAGSAVGERGANVDDRADSGTAAGLQARLTAALKDKEMLLTLDNFEQLAEHASDLLADLLRSSPGMKLLVTSRTRLRLQAEWVMPLGGLEYPAKDGPGSTIAVGPADAPESSALRLFEQAAQRSGLRRGGPGPLAENDLDAVLRICRLVDGHPLALELAAASSAQSSPLEVADTLERGIGALVSDSRDAPSRTASIDAVLEQSWSRLSDSERCQIERLSVFAGGFEEVAASEVAGVERAQLLRFDDLSLLQRAGERYAFHPLVREFARARLVRSAVAEAEARRRHAEHFLERCRDMLRNFWSREKASYLSRLSVEQDNLRSALHWASTNDPSMGLAMARRLWQVWMNWGQLTEGRRWLEAMLEAAPVDENLEERVSVLNGAASLAYLQGDMAEAVRRYEESLALVKRLGDEHHTAIVLNNFGNLLRTRGDLEAAASMYQESLEIRRRLADVVGIASTLSNQGLLAEKRGYLLEARDLFEESLDIRRENGDLGGEAISLCNLGFISVKLGQLADARRYLLQGLSIEHELGGKNGAAYCLLGLGNVERAASQLARAALLWGAADALRRESGSSLGEEAAEHERNIAAVRAEADAVEFDAAWSAGQALTFDEIAARELRVAATTAPPP